VHSYCDAMMIHRIFKITLKFSLRTFFLLRAKREENSVKTPMLIYLYYFFQEINSHRGFMNKQKFSKKFVIPGALCILIVMMILRIFEIQQLIHVSIRPLKYMIPRLKNSICIIIQQEQFFSVHTSYGYCVSQFGRRPLETF